MQQNKIKIAYIISSLAKQGPVQVLLDIVSNIDYTLFDVKIMTLKKESKNSLKKKFEELPLEIVPLMFENKYNNLSVYFKISRYLKSEKIQIIHTHCFRSLLIAFCVRKMVKTVHTIHVYPGLQYVAMNGYFKGKLISYLTKFAIKKVYKPIACSQSVAISLKMNDGISVRAIPNGISSMVENRDQKKMQKELNLDSNFKYFISVGRFSPEKNFELMVKAFIAANIPNTKLILLGVGKTMDSVKKISNENILLMGFKQNVNDYLDASDYYLSTSLTEGMPLSVLEALAHGLPVALSDIPPHQEILNKGDKIGFAFPVNDIQKTAITIEQLYKSDYNELKENAKLVFSKYFKAERMSAEYQKLYIDNV